MAVRAPGREAPASYEDAARLLGRCADSGLRVRIAGRGTKAGWGNPVEGPDVELSTASLDRIVEHNAGDLTAVLQAGVKLADARDAFAEAGQMLALDPPLGAHGAATIGGVVATGDSGPLRHRYGAARDLVLGVAVALPDGSVARAGGKVIKNVAGYDLAKLFAGSFGTLGAIVEVAVRLHPLRETVSAAGTADDPDRVVAAASRLAHAQLEAHALDLAWREGQGGVLARFAGSRAGTEAREAATLLADAGLESAVLDDDARAWEQQRIAQRGELVVRVSTTQSRLADVIRAAEAEGGSMIARAALGLAWVSLPPGEAAATVWRLRTALAPDACVVLDAPPDERAALHAWGPVDKSLLKLMQRTKHRFDPECVCNPGVFAGGI